MSRRKLYPYLYNIPLGSARWYLWLGKGHPRHRVDPDAPDFDVVYGNFRAGISPINKKKEKPEKPIPANTFQHGLFQAYKSVPFILWDKGWRSQMRRILDRMAEELVNPEQPGSRKVGDVELNTIKLKHLNRLVARKIEEGLRRQEEGNRKKGGYGAARNRRRALSWLWGWFRKNGLVKENVALDLDEVKIPKEHRRRHTITEAEIRRYREYWAIGTKQRLGFELGLAGLARSDVVRVGQGHLVERNGILWLEYYRRKTRHLEELNLAVVEVHEELARSIKEHVPSRKDKHGNPVPVVGAVTFLVSDIGPFQYEERNYGEQAFPKWVKAAGLDRRVTTHSLRRGQSVDLAYKGYSHEEINAAQGRAKGSRALAGYLKDLDRRRIADAASARKRKEQSG